MARIHLTEGEAAAIRELVAHTGHAWHLRRALAILWLGQGDSPGEVARRLCVSRASVYNWAARFESRASLDLAARVADGERPGRPRHRLRRAARELGRALEAPALS
jgi:transposase